MWTLIWIAAAAAVAALEFFLMKKVDRFLRRTKKDHLMNSDPPARAARK